MYPFPEAVTPAVRTHIDAQTAFLNDISKSVFRSFQQMFDLNIQLAQTLLEESALASKQAMSADDQMELISAAAARARPTSDKLRAYQQHIARLAADSQVDLARVTEQHVETTTRTARALADEVSRNAGEHTERSLRAQQETMRQFADPFTHSEGADTSLSKQNPSDCNSDAAGHQHVKTDVKPGQAQPGNQAQHLAAAH